MSSSSLRGHYKLIRKAILDGRVVPLLGAGVNLCARDANGRFEPGKDLPSGKELAAVLAEGFAYDPHPQEAECPHCHHKIAVPYPLDLLRVAQHIAVMTGSGPLYDELRRLFNADYHPTPVHTFFANLPGLMRRMGRDPIYQLIVTTNYDDVLERAFDHAKEPYDLVSYVAEGEDRGKFRHTSPDKESRVVEIPNEYSQVSIEKRTVILKIHGAVDRTTPERDSYVITEDHYIDFLTRTDISSLIPVLLAAKMRRSHFLFLGYSLRDWNLRVILHRIWGEQKLSYKSWAVQYHPDDLDLKFWLKRDVDILDAPLDEYIGTLCTVLASEPFT